MPFLQQWKKNSSCTVLQYSTVCVFKYSLFSNGQSIGLVGLAIWICQKEAMKCLLYVRK